MRGTHPQKGDHSTPSAYINAKLKATIGRELPLKST